MHSSLGMLQMILLFKFSTKKHCKKLVRFRMYHSHMKACVNFTSVLVLGIVTQLPSIDSELQRRSKFQFKYEGKNNLFLACYPPGNINCFDSVPRFVISTHSQTSRYFDKLDNAVPIRPVTKIQSRKPYS